MEGKKKEGHGEKKPERRKAEVVKERWREKRRKRLLLKEGVLTLFQVMFLRGFLERLLR